MHLFQTTSLGYTYQTKPLFKGLNLALNPGDCLWIQGDNGAGKTTLLKLLAGLIDPVSGQILWHNQPIQQHPEFAQTLQWLSFKTPLKDTLTGLENLQFLCHQHSPNASPDLQAALKVLHLDKAQHQTVKQYSSGMKRRLLLAKLYCLPAKLWILDEPLTALDQTGIQIFHELCEAHLANQGILVLASHQALNLRPNFTVQTLALKNLC